MLRKIMEKPEVKVLLEMERLSNTEAYRHSISVAGIVCDMLPLTSYTQEEKEQIVTGALLHDIGKVFVPFNLTQLPQSLSAEEYNIIKVHASVSYEIVRAAFSEMVQNICLYHHERPDGSGYMANAVLCNIPQEALLVQVADVYDALTTERSYKKGYDSQKAMEIMHEEARIFHLDDQYVKLLEDSKKIAKK